MFERFSSEARAVVIHAQQHARRLGHRYVGCEHLLLALAASAEPAGVVLRERGVTPDRVEQEIVHRIGLGAGAGLFADLDREALAAIGVDVDAVRARIEAAFGPDVLTRAGHAVHRRRRRLRPARLLRRWRRHRAGGAITDSGTGQVSGRYQASGPLPSGHIPFTPASKKVLENTLREAQARHDNHIGVEHVALGLLVMERGAVPPILSALDTSSSALGTAIRDRYRQAS